MKHLEILARQIAAQHVSHIFGIPGSGPSLFLLDALEKQGARFHLTHFEGSAALMAGALGKLSGRSGVAVSIKGPGLTNMLPGPAAYSSGRAWQPARLNLFRLSVFLNRICRKHR